MDILVLSKFWQLWIKMYVDTYLGEDLCVDIYSIFKFFEYSPRSTSFRQYDRNIFLRNHQTVFQNDWIILYSTSNLQRVSTVLMYKEFLLFNIPYQHSMISVFWILAVLIGGQWYLIRVLGCISLTIYDVYNIFMLVISTSIFFDEVSVKVLVHF